MTHVSQSLASSELGPDFGPPGESEIVARVRHLCWLAHNSAEGASKFKESGAADAEEDYEYELSRAKSYLRDAVAEVGKLTDDFYLSAGLESVIAVCVGTGELTTALALLRHIPVARVRAHVLDDYPVLKHEPAPEALRA